MFLRIIYAVAHILATRYRVWDWLPLFAHSIIDLAEVKKILPVKQVFNCVMLRHCNVQIDKVLILFKSDFSHRIMKYLLIVFVRYPILILGRDTAKCK